MLRTIASVVSRGLGRRGICIGSTLPVLSTIGGDGDIALQQQADFLLVVGPGERTDLTASGGPTGQAQALQLRWIRIGGDREAAGHSCLNENQGSLHCPLPALRGTASGGCLGHSTPRLHRSPGRVEKEGCDIDAVGLPSIASLPPQAKSSISWAPRYEVAFSGAPAPPAYRPAPVRSAPA